MRPIHTAQLDKRRPVLVLRRELVRPHLARVTVVPASLLGSQIGILPLDQEDALTTALHAAFDLD